MTERKRQEDATLIDVLIDGFEKNEMLRGFHWRELPMPDEASAMSKFDALGDEARRWKGVPVRTEDASGRRLMVARAHDLGWKPDATRLRLASRGSRSE